jgi:hypothetical protein
MTTPNEIRDIVRRHHVHYDFATLPPGDAAPGIDGGVVLRLWAVHQKGARALPGCDKCRPLMSDLRSLAHFVFHGGDIAVFEEAFRAALYDSAVVPGADEVALEVRLSLSGQAGNTPGGARQGLKRVRALLQALGVPER